MFGFLNIYKQTGMTSHDVVAVLRKITKIKQIGHTGTLDPFAEGVLPVCIGKSTRLIEYLSDDKAYIATIQFGKTTDTYDIEGETTSISDKKITENDILKELKNFEGEIEQTPPIYSAIKIKGKKLYEYAREGQTVEVAPRKINIAEIRLLSFNKNEQQAEIYVKCSKGTYIRSLGYDIGQNLGCGGYLTKLVRVQAGDFGIDSTIKLDELTIEDIKANLIYPLDKLPLPQIELSESELEKISHGIAINRNEQYAELSNVVLTHNKELVAIALYENNTIKAKKVFYGN